MAAPALVAAVDSLPALEVAGEAFRHIANGYEPLSGSGARIHGGRWNPPNSYAVLYLANDMATVAAEFHRVAFRQRRQPSDFLPRTLYRYELTLSNALDLRQPSALDAVDLRPDDVESDDLTRCQRVGEAAHQTGREAVVARSATGHGDVLALFLDRLEPTSQVHDELVETWDTLTDVPTSP